MPSPLFSIITVCKNEPEERLIATCESIVGQTFRDFEWIVIDGGSNAETLAIWEKYRDQITSFVSEPDGGIYPAMNKGIRQVTGEWLNFMNAGDRFAAPDVLARISMVANKDANSAALFGIAKFIGGINDNKIDELFLYRYGLPQQVIFFRRGVFARLGNFQENLRIVADWEFLWRMTRNGCRFFPLMFVVADYDLHGISSTAHIAEARERAAVLKAYFSWRKRLVLCYRAGILRKAVLSFLFRRGRWRVCCCGLQIGNDFDWRLPAWWRIKIGGKGAKK
jgi:glycosyltransferase involved in cell wall biosynthesis